MFILSSLLLVPLITALLAALAPAKSAKRVAVAGALATFLLSLGLLGYNGALPFQFVESRNWLPALGISYHVGVDGPAVLLILLTTFLQLFAVLYSSRFVTTREKEYYALLMVLETAMIGSFCALDLVLFYVFFELCLIPPYFLIGIWGGKQRIAAANKFFVYTVVGSLLMLVSILGLYLHVRATPVGTGTFDFVAIRAALASYPLPTEAALWMFAGFAIAFAVKTGVFPFHTWLPDTYAESPTAVTVLLSGVLAKLGTYGFYRFCIMLFPGAAQQFAPFMVGLAVISIIYGALVAAMQRDVKRVIAYSSVSHLGFVVLGLFSLTPQGMTGAILQMINHGVSTGALFLLVGFIQERRGTTIIRQMGGLWEQMPLFGRLFLIVTLSSIALPLTNGFVGEFLILLGAFQTFPWATGLATTGVIWSAVYMLWMFQRVMYGPVDKPANRRLNDISSMEVGLLVPFIVLIFVLGVYPALALRKTDAAVAAALANVSAPTETQARALPQAAALADASHRGKP